MNLNDSNIGVSQFQDICRLCLNKFPTPNARFLIHGTTIEDHSLEKMLVKLCKIEVKEDDNLPQHVCADCIFSLGQVHDFYELCQKSNQTLIEILKQVQEPKIIIQPLHEEKVNKPLFVPIQPKPVGNNDKIPIQRLHRLLKRDEKGQLIECPTCDIIFPNSFQYRKHKATHQGKKENVQNSQETQKTVQEEKENKQLDESSSPAENSDIKINLSLKRNEKGQLLECPKCNTVLPTRYQYQKHKRMHDTQQKNQNSEKIKGNQSETSESEKPDKNSSEDRSLRRDSKGRPLECAECGVLFPSNYQLLKHKSTHDMPYECPICKRKFKTPAWLKSHLQTHGDDRLKRDRKGRLVQCEICHKICSSYHTYRNHKHEHTGGQKPHVCPHCGQDFLIYSKLKLHLYTHTEERPISCPVCSKRFKNQVHLHHHVRNVHTEQPPIEVKCTKCDRVFDSALKMRRHRARHNIIPYLCSICGTYLARRAHWVMHMRSHNGEKPFKCQYCDKAFVTNFLLKYHTNTHTGEKPYRCDVCGEAFASPRRLQTHKKIHGSIVLYKCADCDVEFTKKLDLIRHMKMHARQNSQEEIDDELEYVTEMDEDMEYGREIDEDVEYAKEIEEGVEYAREIEENIEYTKEIEEGIEYAKEIEERIEYAEPIHSSCEESN